jgi:hypothetical protein
MFTKSITKVLAALALSLLAFVSIASAQYGMPDFTNFDFSGYMQQQYDMTTNMINGEMNGILQQRGPEIQAAYQQCLYSGGYCGSFEEYALQYVSTNGFSDGGAWAMTQRGMQQKEYEAWWGVKQAEADSAAAINGWNSNYAQNQGEMGNILMGNSSWVNPNSGTNYQLPYTLQPNSFYYDQSSQQQFWYDPYGQYHILSPDSSWWMPLNPWQAGQ